MEARLRLPMLDEAVILFGLAITSLGLLESLHPRKLIGLVSGPWQSGAGIYLAVGLRLAFGLVLIGASTESRFPAAFQILGAVSLAAAAAIPVLGKSRLQRFVNWWTARPMGFIRAWGLGAAGFGAFLVYGALQ